MVRRMMIVVIMISRMILLMMMYNIHDDVLPVFLDTGGRIMMTIKIAIPIIFKITILKIVKMNILGRFLGSFWTAGSWPTPPNLWPTCTTIRC